MSTNWDAQQGNATDAAYSAFLQRVSNRYFEVAGRLPVFLTDADDLWVRYMEQFPEHERQVHNCNACRHFIERYAGLVVVDPVTGKTVSVLWEESDAPDMYKAPVLALKKSAEKAKIVAPFVSSDRVFGEPKTGIWTHLHARNPKVWSSCTEAPHQRMAKFKQDYLMLIQALADYPVEVARKAAQLLEGEALYRSERFTGPAKWFLKMHEDRDRLTGSVRNNLIWLAVATAPEGYAHVRSNVIGTLLDDIKAGLPFEDIKRRFADKTNSSTYQRAQAAPAAGAIQQAEKLFAELALEPALPRRYARLGEVPAMWRPHNGPSTADKNRGGVFAHLTAKDAPAQLADLSVPAKAITWEKFLNRVVPTATKIEVVVPDTTERFMAITTAVNEDAPPLLQWDKVEQRNSFSWYYAAGVDAEIKRRVESRGGMHSGVDIRCSLMWEGRTDLDIHCITPQGTHIHYNSKTDNYSGALDVDANAMCLWNLSDTPVENIRWPKGRAPSGRYQFYVHHYQTAGRQAARTPFVVELEVDGQVFHFHGATTRQGDRVNLPVLDYQRGERLQPLGGFVRAGGNPSEWGLLPKTYVPVTAITTSPNLWYSEEFAHCGRHAFFLLEGCKDLQAGVGRGFFTEQLRGDLRPVRAVLEAHLAQAEIEGTDEASACGIGISSQGTGDLVVRVTSSTGQMLYKIDRWD